MLVYYWEREYKGTKEMNKWLSPNKVFLALSETFFRLIEPHNPRQHPTRLRRMRLLSGMLVFMIPLTLIGAFATMPNRSSGENTYIYLLIGFILFVFSYLLNSIGRDKLAIWSVLLYLTILPFVAWYSKNNYSFQEFYGSFIWIFLAILLASLLLDPWSVSIFAVMNIVILLFLPKVVPDLEYIMVYDFLSSFIPLAILLVAGSALRRSDIEIIEHQNIQMSIDEVHLSHLLTSNPAVVYSALPAKGHPITFVSSNAANRLGYSSEEIMSDPDFWEMHVHADDAPGFLDGFSSLLEQGSHTQIYRFRLRDGTYRWIRDEQRLLLDSEDQPLEIAGYFSDITENVQIEEILRVKDKALNSAANAILITNTAGNITWVNSAFSDLTGYKLEEVLGANPRILRSGQHSKEFYQDLWKTITTGNIWRGELINKRKDGSLYDEEMTITPVKDQRGNI
ncbi:MAG: PAS domain S-box protein, partial [Anaerolineaceae bacterium]